MLHFGEAFIKSIAQAIPLFVMTVFKIPKLYVGFVTPYLNYGGAFTMNIEDCTGRNGGHSAY